MSAAHPRDVLLDAQASAWALPVCDHYSGEYKIVEGLPIDAFSQECINKTLAELEGEKDGVKHLL